MARKLILDVDTGTDDAVAILLAALHPDLELLGVTTVNGNVPVEYCTDNSLRVLDLIGRSDVPVHEGLSRPIVRLGFPGAKRFRPDSPLSMHGLSLPLPEARTAKRDGSAVDYLLETLRGTPDEITLVAVGPLSNLAAVLAIDPRIVEAVPEVVIMGGGHHVGNETASAEFNIWADSEAAEMVFEAGFHAVTLVPLDATHQALMTRQDCDDLAALGTPAGVAAAELIGRRVDAYTAGRGVAVADAAPVHDAVCTAYLVEPAVIRTRRLHVSVETQGRHTVGRTVMDTRTGSTQVPNCAVAMAADRDLFVHVLAQALGPVDHSKAPVRASSADAAVAAES